MPADIQELIQSLVRSEYQHERKDSREAPTPPLVTISRDHGSGGCEIARRLAKALNIPIWDREILDAIAHAANSDPELMAQLDDKIKTRKDTWIYNLLSGQNAFIASYRHHLVNVALALAQRGGVIIGRGVHLILANRPVFRLRVVGSLDTCARRVMASEQLDYERAIERVKQVNKERDQFLWDTFHHHLDESACFDLIINTDKFDDRWDDTAEQLLRTIRLTGLDGRGGGTS